MFSSLWLGNQLGRKFFGLLVHFEIKVFFILKSFAVDWLVHLLLFLVIVCPSLEKLKEYFLELIYLIVAALPFVNNLDFLPNLDLVLAIPLV